MVFALTYMGAGGGVRSVIETTNGLVKLGHEVYIFNPGGCRSGFVTQLAGSINMGPNWDATNSSSIKDMHIDVFFNQDPATAEWSGVVKSKVKILHLCSGFPTAYDIFKGRHSEWYSMVTSCNKMLQLTWNQNNISPIPQCVYIGQGINPDMFYPVSGPENVIIFCSRGGISKWNAKGGETIAKAIPFIDKRAKFIGWDTDKHTDLGTYGISEVITNPEIHANMREKLYGLGDIVIAPDYISAWNCVAGEGMACGKAVVCSDQGTEDFAINGVNALVYPAGDYQALAKQVNLLINEPNYKKQLAENAAETMKNWTWFRVVDQLLLALKEVGCE